MSGAGNKFPWHSEAVLRGNHIKYSIRENGGKFVTQNCLKENLVANDADMPKKHKPKHKEREENQAIEKFKELGIAFAVCSAATRSDSTTSERNEIK